MSKASGSIDLKSLKVAGEGASKYITEISGDGIRVHDANTINNSVVINSDGMEIFKGGTTSAYSVAKYGDTVRVGASSTGHTNIASSGMQIYGSNGTVNLANIGYGPAVGDNGPTTAPYYTLGTRAEDSVGAYSFATGQNNIAKADSAHAEGYGTTASGASSHSEGNGTIAGGKSAHAEGWSTKANSDYSHAEGNGSEAGATCAHAEGETAKAYGVNSHAQNCNTVAQRKSQTAIGEYNKIESGSSSTRGNYAFIIGNGESAIARSDALTVEWSGNVNIASGAKYKIGGVNLSPTDLGAADYITSKGTSGVWKYEKWASGKVEAWSTGISTGTLTMAAQGNMYRASNLSFTIPSGIFPEAPTNTEVFAGYSAAVFVAASGDASSATAISCQVWKATNATAAVNLKFHCVYYPSSY